MAGDIWIGDGVGCGVPDGGIVGACAASKIHTFCAVLCVWWIFIFYHRIVFVIMFAQGIGNENNV